MSVDRDRLVSLMAAVAAQLDDTEVSLSRFEAGTYGICDYCRQPIPPARLEAVPNARLCVSCKARGINSRRSHSSGIDLVSMSDSCEITSLRRVFDPGTRCGPPCRYEVGGMTD